MVTWTIVPLALMGLLISSYFTAVAYRWMEPDHAWVPKVCRLGERTCATIIDTPRGRLFGLPNSVLGQVFYVALLIGVPAGLVTSTPWMWAYLAGSALTVGVGVFLTYSLLFVTRVRCRLCFASHAINLVIFLLLLVANA